MGRGKSGTPIFSEWHRDVLPIKGDSARRRETECGNLDATPGEVAEWLKAAPC
jgi:hypothetical protein